jgi:hypothetical protein
MWYNKFVFKSKFHKNYNYFCRIGFTDIIEFVKKNSFVRMVLVSVLLRS